MSKLKITSDPYKNEISYEKPNSEGEWEPITSSNSKLLSERLTKCVFPFNVKEIVDVIFGEFRSGEENIEIVFEGTDDEFEDLRAVCSDECYDGAVTAAKLNSSLRNARDIFHEVKSKFAEVERLVYRDDDADESIERERQQFADVSKEIIPICVVGNYSCGKSTFINALIGYEILPSGDKPLTAKIHRISESDNKDRSHIGFKYSGEDILFEFKGSEKPKLPEMPDSALFEKLRDELERLKEYSPVLCANKTLSVLNRVEDGNVGDLIEIEIPFNDEGDFGRSRHKFVIFDTPGSNTASNANHFAVLKKAMENLSNGLPIYVSECNDLDTKDNEQLCQLIKDMKELDSRFSMIVVNKADDANFEEFSEEAVLNQVVPRKLYSGGLYYVSSIMGLGAKSDGKFIDRHYNKIFSVLKSTFDDPEDEYYEQLFKYDICPKQIKKKAVEQSEHYGDKILANSGLYWIEKEIENFAGKYSPYNKCRQALLYLENAMDKTESRIEEAKNLYEREKQNFENQLEEGKKQLINELEECSEKLKGSFFGGFPEAMKPTMEKSDVPIDKEQLDKLKDVIYQVKKEQSTYDAQSEKLSDTGKTFSDNTQDMLDTDILNFREFQKMGKRFVDNAKEIVTQKVELYRTQRELESKTSDEIFSRVKEMFNSAMSSAQSVLNDDSIEYWTAMSVTMRHELIKTVTGTSTLDEEKKNALADIISKYEPISFDKQADEIFALEDFKPVFKILGIKLFENSRLNLSKLQRSYNKQMEQGINDLFERVRKAHTDVFSAWVTELLIKTKVSITDFNPELRDLVKSIDNKDRLIKDLEYRQEKLHRITDEIAELMSWQEV